MQHRKKRIIAKNKRARYEYEIIETYEAGIALTGTEIKSIRQGRVNLQESYAKIGKDGMMILGMHISPYEQGNIFNVDPVRPRRLLLHKRELRKIKSDTKEKGFTIVPLSLYINEEGRAKLEIAVVRGKKLYDKREDIAKRDAKRRMDRERRKDV